MSLIRLKDVSLYELRLPSNMSAYGLPTVLELPLLTFNWPCVELLAGWVFRICSQKTPALKVCVPQILETVSLRLGRYLSAYRPLGPPTSKRPMGNNWTSRCML